MAGSWTQTWLERLERQEKDERIYRAIKTEDWRTALMELFVIVRRVSICKHGNMTDYEKCPQCESDLDEMMRAPEDE